MAQRSETAVTGRPPLDEVASWAGFRLDDVNGGHVGKVEGVLIDTEGGSPEWLLTRMGRFGHHTAVPARDAVAAVQKVWVPYTRDQMRQAPKVDPKHGLPRDRELELLGHYGIGGEAGRAGEVAGRSADAITSKPAA